MSAKKTYRELRRELDELMSSFESAAHDDVESMMKDYNAAMKLVKQLEAMLASAKKKLKEK